MSVECEIERFLWSNRIPNPINLTLTEKQKYNPLKDRPMSEPKVPVYETKVLTIDTGAVKKTGTGSGGGDGGGNGRSVRQHLRRGHIRRLKSGNLWVQSCVVGSDKNGIITKNIPTQNSISDMKLAFILLIGASLITKALTSPFVAR